MTLRERVTSPNKVCPSCAEGFSLAGVLIPTTPNHDACMGTVPDLDAPGGGWDCQCECRRPQKRRTIWVPGWANKVRFNRG